jgi:hypothetical protein
VVCIDCRLTLCVFFFRNQHGDHHGEVSCLSLFILFVFLFYFRVIAT